VDAAHRRAALGGLLAGAALATGWVVAGASRAPEPGVNPAPVRLVRPAARPLSEMARLGREMFFDSSLSRSGTLACATCHDPAHAYGPPDDTMRRSAAADGERVARAVPGLRYADRVPPFSIGPDAGVEDQVRPAPASAAPTARGPKLAGMAAAAPSLVPRGGLFWDGRAGSLQRQALGPLFNPQEMANRDTAALAGRLRRRYGARLAALVGPQTVADARELVYEVAFAVARFETEDASFHPYSSKYDAYLEGRARLTAAEARGLAAFEDPSRGNCAGCHLDRPDAEGHPPPFTDYEYEALGAPRNASLPSNHDSLAYDLGLCGPARIDLRATTRYCGMFRTPSLRNAATRRVFFHNGVFHSLEEVLAFYALRDARPDALYSRGPDGRVRRFDDLPSAYRSNVDTADPPFGRRLGAGGALSGQDRRDIIAFLETLTDGYRGAGR